MEIKTRSEIREIYALKIESIKNQAKNDIARAKHERLMELSADSDLKIIEKIKYKESKRLIKEEKNRILQNLPKPYSTGEEIFNSVTHGIGTGLAVAATVLLIVKASLHAPESLITEYVASWSIYGACLIILYLMSTLYHALTPRKAKAVFSIFDHCAIYLLIAGTYTPFCLATLHGSTGWILFGIIWGLTILGITLYSVFGKRLKVLYVIMYIAMGWLIFFAYKPMKAVMPPLCIMFLIAGGVSYTVGVIFYSLKKIKWMHPIWHLFVLAGSILHFFSVYYSL